MPIKVLELHHHGIRIGKSTEDVAKAQEFYTDVLGLQADTGRPNIPGIPGFWLYVGNDQNTAQIHKEAKRELDQRGVWYWQIQGLVGQNSDQIFVRDPFGNVIELHQIGTCRCNKAALPA